MADDIRPPSMDDDSEPEVGPFNDFVNHHLDLSDLDSTGSAAPPRAPNPFTRSSSLPPTPPLPGLHRMDSEDIDHSLFEDDDDDADPAPPPGPPFGGKLNSPASPFWRRSGEPARPEPPEPRRRLFGTDIPSASSLPPRIPFPSSTDSRWISGVYSVRDDLEIFSPPSLFSLSRVTIVANASRRMDKRIEYIRDISPGWSAVRLILHPGRMPITGYVRTASVHLRSTSHFRRNLLELLDMRITLIDVLVLIAAVLLVTAVVSQVVVQEPVSNPPADVDQRLAELEVRLEHLEASAAISDLR